MTKSKKIMRSLKIEEISGVDKPAQAGARAVIMKRHEPEEEEDVVKTMRLTTSRDGHAHLVEDAVSFGRTSFEHSAGDQFSHDHPVVRNSDGSLTIGQSSGHSHGLLAMKIAVDMATFTAEQVTKAEKSASGGQETELEKTTMTDVEKAAAEKAEAAEKERVEKLEADLKFSKAYGELTDAQKAHYSGLSDELKPGFLEKSSTEKDELIAKASEADAVVYTDSEGNEYRKSDDKRIVDSARRADNAVKVAQAAEKRAQDSDLQKRADDMLKHLPGEDAAKIEVLKALDGIADEGLRTKAFEMLKANGEALSVAFENRGTREAGSLRKADDQLEALAKKHAETYKVDIISARVAVLDTPEGNALYQETLRPMAASA